MPNPPGSGAARTMLVLPLLFLGFIVSPAGLACDIPAQKYRSYAEGGHYVLILDLSADGEYALKHYSWLAGQPDSLQEVEYLGTWDCVGNTAVLSDPEASTADYRIPDSYPLGIFRDVEALVFPASGGRESLLSGEVLWPASLWPDNSGD